jgi:hypothetical protein
VRDVIARAADRRIGPDRRGDDAGRKTATSNTSTRHARPHSHGSGTRRRHPPISAGLSARVHTLCE